MHTLRLRTVLCLLSSVLCLSALAQVKDTTIAPPPEPVKPIAEVINPALPTLWVASDSTAANGGPNATGWGVPLPDYFDLTKINVVNRARGGRSSRTFITEGLWDKLLEGVKAGDFVLIQFGHNDAGPVNEDESVPREKRRSRGSIPTLGEETQEIDNIVTTKHEVIHSYGWYMRKMVADVKAKGATPVILSLTVRNEWKAGKVERNNGPWRKFSKQIAETAGIAYVDLTRLIADEYQKLGQEKVSAFFPKDHTHTGPAGADLNASLVVAGLKGIKKGPFVAFLSAKGAAVAEDKIGWLNLPEPANPALPSLVCIGDSTVRNGRGDGAGEQWGWGDELSPYFDSAKINIVNRAVGGLSSRTFLTQGHWDRALTLIKPGDYVIMQFGHNDNGALNDNSRARGTIKGTGEESEEIDNILTKQHETVHTYGWYLRKFIREAKAAGATPIVCSPIPRKTWDKEGHINRNKADYAAWAAEVAQQEGVGFIDLNDLVATRYDALGHDTVMKLFPQVTPDEHTHPNLAGAQLNAQIVTAGLRALPGAPLDAWLSPKGAGLAPAK
jgi:lysophospholipase L1-like esterase